MAEENEGFSSQWNTSLGLTHELARLRIAANSFFVVGRLSDALTYLLAVRQTASSVFSEPERKKLLGVEKEIYKNSFEKFTRTPRGFQKAGNEFFVAAARERLLYNKYNDLLNDCLQKHDLLLLERADQIGLKD